MELTLVPFGYLEAKDKLVDVHQVPSGKKCGCFCPSCHAPLIARKGNKKIWHFAHDSKSELSSKLEKCSYSFYVSARMMALQLIDKQLSMILPKYVVTLSEQLPISNRYVQVSETVTESRHIVLDRVSVDEEISGCNVDLLGYVSGYPLAVVFSHPGRKEHWRLEGIQDQKIGVVEITLDALKDRFRVVDSINSSYSDILKDYITNEVSSKRWIHHPNFRHCEALAQSKLKAEVSKASALPSTFSKTRKNRIVDDDSIFEGLKSVQVNRTTNTKFNFICRLCNSAWSGIGNDDAKCQKCGTSLMVSRSEVPSDET